MNKLLATDLDGTLFYPKKFTRCIPKKNLEFLQRWIDDGNRLVLATSRSLQFTKRLTHEINRPFDIMVNNTSQIIIDEKLVRDEQMDNKKLTKLLIQIERKYHPLGYLMSTWDYPCIIKNNRSINKMLLNCYKIWRKMQGALREPYVFDNKIFQRQLEEGKIYKIVIFFGLSHGKNTFSRDLNQVMRDDYPGFEFSWVGPVNEITNKNCSKAQGLDFYCKYLNIDKKDVYVAGDSGNDISMFKQYHENSFCMKHATSNVKKYATYVVPSVHHIEKYLPSANQGEVK